MTISFLNITVRGKLKYARYFRRSTTRRDRMKTWCLATLSFVLFSALFFDTCSSAAFSEETATSLGKSYNEETKGFEKAALNDREENDHWVREYDENDVDDHDWANHEDDAANKDENDEDQSDMENEEGVYNNSNNNDNNNNNNYYYYYYFYFPRLKQGA